MSKRTFKKALQLNKVFAEPKTIKGENGEKKTVYNLYMNR